MRERERGREGGWQGGEEGKSEGKSLYTEGLVREGRRKRTYTQRV